MAGFNPIDGVASWMGGGLKWGAIGGFGTIAVGTAIGFMMGGPFGALAGFAIGSVASLVVGPIASFLGSQISGWSALLADDDKERGEGQVREREREPEGPDAGFLGTGMSFGKIALMAVGAVTAYGISKNREDRQEAFEADPKNRDKLQQGPTQSGAPLAAPQVSWMEGEGVGGALKTGMAGLTRGGQEAIEAIRNMGDHDAATDHPPATPNPKAMEQGQATGRE